MPKKKDKKNVGKQDEKKNTSTKESLETPVDRGASDNREKELYLIQVRYLNEQLERYQQKCDQLEREKKDYSSQHRSLEKEKKDIVDYLKRSLLEKEDEVDELKERLEVQRQAADQDRDAVQLQNSQLREELQGRINELTAENTALVARLDGLAEFQRQKEELKSSMESLKKQLTIQEEKHKADIHDLKMKVLLEKKKLEKEMESHVAAIAADVQHQVDQKVPGTTRLALQENTELKAQLDQLSIQSQVLMEENSALLDRKRRLRGDVENLEQMLRETSRQSCILKKVVGQLTEKCQQLQAELKERSQELEQLQTEKSGLQAEMETLRQDRNSLKEQCSKNRAEVSRLEAELQEERRKRSRMKSIIQEAVGMLRETLMEDLTEQDLEVDSVVQSKQLMQRLLVVLDRPTLNNQQNEQQTSDSAAARELTLNPALSFQFQIARYSLAELSIVPRPSPKNKRAISSGTSVALHRTPSSCYSHCRSAWRRSPAEPAAV
ncbi:cilia- and flagella-associated protein 157-like isoform X2 [Notolabrus celidotus]|uniref:cilia- and flagella-associated protein 157-like isoform X2 n=1 Tax=Notolabrus celidotus TaxID=1203425 RepID=UPI0014907C79|nr:cilia- and flagella-associated protein 157-like isoform X2 [Notolabrus celidotus]